MQFVALKIGILFMEWRPFGCHQKNSQATSHYPTGKPSYRIQVTSRADYTCECLQSNIYFFNNFNRSLTSLGKDNAARYVFPTAFLHEKNQAPPMLQIECGNLADKNEA
jgi:hypothetical protein